MIARKYLAILALSAPNKRFFSQGALIISKLRNRLNKETFGEVICLKSQGIFKDEEEELEKKEQGPILEEDNLFFIQTKDQFNRLI